MANISFNIWPPSQRTHDAVVNCPIETLFEPSVLSKHYRSMSYDKADTTAHHIKDKAFVAASTSASADETTSRSYKSTPTRSTNACWTLSSPELPPDLHPTIPQRLPLSTLLLPPMRKSHSLKLSRVLIQLHICLCWGFDAIFLY
ncbi:MFP1 attachment factor 1 [Camellia lanceoleosa]|uniref:MFP1 attachment factor 1 n=1 Tax=Camellia lanceoleosa TaxID=1840588 RepID=A0ACC0HIC4_9ERIC|nr:MFP1 attachment factor 1 [Camellia lanceoleosa]